MGFCDVDIDFYTIEKLKQFLFTIKEKKIVLILTDSGMNRWGLSSIIKSFKQCNSVCHINYSIANPHQTTIVNALRQIEFVPDMIIAIGGGSSIDLAKSISALHSVFFRKKVNEDLINHAIDHKIYYNSIFIEIIAVPTTAGTGSEITSWATVWDKFGHIKRSIEHLKLVPKKALIISEFIFSLPPKLLLCTTLDALSHAIEAFWARNSNDLIKDIAIRAVELIVKNLSSAQKNRDIFSFEALVRASVLAGISFSQTHTTACHAISYPLSSMYHIEHGLAVAITLPSVYQINRCVVARMNELDLIFEQFEGIANWLNSVCKNQVFLNLSEYGISEKEIENIVANCFTKERMNNNPIILEEKQVKKILLSCL